MKDTRRQYFFEILRKYRLNQASDKEIAFLEAYYNLFEINGDFESEDDKMKEAAKRNIDQKIALHEHGTKRKPRRLFQKYAVAAAVLLAVSFGTYFLIKKYRTSQNLFAAAKNISAGRNKAMLTLSNGSRISLTDAANGSIIKQSGISVTKSRDGQLVYTASETAETSILSSSFNTIETPKGGQYQITLPDGTNVWLNAASTLRYPVAFAGNDRKVELNGEAYFEVAKNPAMPFRIVSKGQVAEVLGTHFNINAYQDEPGIKTTLLEGSVRIVNLSSSKTVILKPGQQSDVTDNGLVTTTSVNPEQFIAWKNGKFIFANADIESIMRQVSRWYNVEVAYKGDISKEKFGGRVSRFTNVAELLEILELTDQVHFKIEGRRITVMP